MVTQDQVLAALRQVLDPELHVNIVDLGLVYSAEVNDGKVHVALTLTTPACPLGASVVESAESAIWRDVPGVESVRVHLVWSPPWKPAMMSDAARAMLGWR